MAINRDQARQLTQSPVVDAVFDEYEGALFMHWASATSPDERERIYSKYQVVREVKQQLKNTAVDIDEHGRNTA